MPQPLPLVYRTGKDGKRVLAVEVDNVISVGTGFQVQLTDNPVEDGSDVTDNQQVKSRVHKVEAFVSDYHPDGGTVPGRARAVWDALEELKTSRELLVLVLPLVGEQRNMRVESVDTTITVATNTTALRFNASFKEVRVATSKRVPALKRREEKMKPNVELGQKSTTEADAPTKARSKTLLKQFFDAARGQG